MEKSSPPSARRPFFNKNLSKSPLRQCLHANGGHAGALCLRLRVRGRIAPVVGRLGLPGAGPAHRHTRHS
eukprot:scaffold72533_cov33-Tisochrysis_lutea.AAC.2